MDDIGFWILVSIGIVVSVMLATAVIGIFLPRLHRVTCALALKQTPEVVWQVVTDHAHLPEWHAKVTKVERLLDKRGHEVWRETYKGDYGLVLETTEVSPPTRLVRTITDEKGPFTGRWEFTLTPTETGCRLSITEFGAVRNPFFRFMIRLFMKPEVYLEMYLQALAHKFGEPATIEKYVV